MGSLVSKPKAKAPRAQVVFVPAPPPSAAAPAPAQSDPPAPKDNKSATDESRVKGLLLRNRGSFGSILTSFKGLLTPSVGAGSRKTLLGE